MGHKTFLEYKTFAEFWPFYISQHLNRTNRRLHFAGTTLALLTMMHWLWLVLSTLNSIIWPIFVMFGTIIDLPLALVLGYGLAWAGHFFFEGNKPATLQYPLWSLRGDFKMYWLMWRGRMDNEIIWLQAERPQGYSGEGINNG